MRGLCFEIWFNPSQPDGVLMSAGKKGVLELAIVDHKYRVTIEGKQFDSLSSDHQVKLDVWNHVALNLEMTSKSIELYHNAAKILETPAVHMDLKEIGKDIIQVAKEFEGRLTEVRVWSRVRSMEDIKANMTVPLSIVSEQGEMVIININRTGTDGKPKSRLNSVEVNFDFGDINMTPTEGGFDNWNFNPEDIKDPQQEPEIVNQSKPIDTKRKFSEQIPMAKQPKKRGNSPQSAMIKPNKAGEEPLRPEKREEVATKSAEMTINQPDFPKNEIEMPNLFSKHFFLSSLQLTDEVEHLLKIQFSNISSQSIFIQNLSGLLLKLVKYFRHLYLKDVFDRPLELVNALFLLLKEVACTYSES